MFIVKLILLLCVFGTSSIIGIIISKKYSNRVHILKQIKNGLGIFELKLNYSCETIPEVFTEISKKIDGTAGEIFSNMVANMEKMPVTEAWEKSINENSDCLNIEDINSLKPLGKLLGKTDVQGQISQVKIVQEFIDKQMLEAIEDKNKNSIMYKKLGAVVGIMLVIVLI